ncbi:MAG: hypothetical protein NC112_03765 [Oxalobacter formigenes]|nr:hypothetical protein [Oxalobacter formigenes]
MAKEIPENFRQAAASLYGYNGGNLESPIWLCALEWGGGYSPEKPEDPADQEKGFFADFEPEPISPQTLKGFIKGDWNGDGRGRQGGSAFYRVQVGLLKAIIDAGAYDGKDPAEWVDAFRFFDKGCYGLSLNAFPVSMSGRSSAWQYWYESKVLKVGGELLSFAEWTGIDTFYQYLDWVIETRRETFCAFRRKYRPAIIYCGGKGEAHRFFQLWTDGQDKDAEKGELHIGRFKSRYYWLNNGEKHHPTLLVLGYFFGSAPYALNSYEDIFQHGKALRELCDDKFNDGGAWLQREKFMPGK